MDEIIERYLELVDKALPGFVTGLYLRGSVAIGAYQDGPSDIDALAVTSRPATATDLDALRELHATLAGKPYFDVVYLDERQVAEQWDAQQVVPFVVNGGFHTDRPCGDLVPVLWLTLAKYQMIKRGPELTVTVDAESVRKYNIENLLSYWAPLAHQLRTALADLSDDAECDAASVEWCVLGPARLLYTIEHLDVISKSRAGAYLGERFPRFADLADRAVRWRAGEPVTFTATDGRAAADSIDAVVSAASD